MRRAPNLQEISKVEISEFQHGETFGNYRLLLPSISKWVFLVEILKFQLIKCGERLISKKFPSLKFRNFNMGKRLEITDYFYLQFPSGYS